MKSPRDAAFVEKRVKQSTPKAAHQVSEHGSGEAANTESISGNSQHPGTDDARSSLVLQGFFVLGQIPYAMKAVRERCRRPRTGKIAVRTRLEPGDQQEIDVVRLIFELYKCQNMPVNHILNSLRAQNIPPHRNVAGWSLGRVDRILTDPVYIGASRFKEAVRYNAFQPIVEPWIFYAALSRRHFDKLSKAGSSLQQDTLTENANND